MSKCVFVADVVSLSSLMMMMTIHYHIIIIIIIISCRPPIYSWPVRLPVRTARRGRPLTVGRCRTWQRRLPAVRTAPCRPRVLGLTVRWTDRPRAGTLTAATGSVAAVAISIASTCTVATTLGGLRHRRSTSSSLPPASAVAATRCDIDLQAVQLQRGPKTQPLHFTANISKTPKPICAISGMFQHRFCREHIY